MKKQLLLDTKINKSKKKLFKSRACALTKGIYEKNNVAYKTKGFIRNSVAKVPNKPFEVTGPYIKSDTLHVNLYLL
ncbi:hypothetical protein DB313_04640 (plasmid) [Borrelia turcica IST7]|uniref:Uncharacterized protein n=1 Tax=Borrelia turcica IST7 TaxID=1104446 RepID=A0A386PP02_9SPIR|nr:hypothetical protein DB313_04640 [Borrelia turcica IST7]